MKAVLYIFAGALFSISTITGAEVQLLDVMLKNYEYPFEVKRFNVSNQRMDLSMAYMDVMPETFNGTNVLLLHGKNFNGACWETTAMALVEEGYRVIIPDQIGFGKSSKPHHFHYTFHVLASNTKALLDLLGVEIVMVTGHSMGGMLATRFVLMYPDMSEKLVLVNPIGLEDWKLKVPYRPVEWWYERELNKTFQDIKEYQLQSYYDGTWKDSYDRWVNVLAGWTLNSDYERIAWNAALTYDMIFTQPVVYEFRHITCPTLLIIGTRDRTALGKSLVNDSVRQTMGRYDKLGKETRDKIPDAELVELAGIGHLPHIESFDKFIKPYRQFLRK